MSDMQYKCNKFSIPNEYNSSAQIEKIISSSDFESSINCEKKKLSWKKSQLFQNSFSLVLFPLVVSNNLIRNETMNGNVECIIIK